MSNDILRYLVAGFLVLHGLGHAGGYWMFVKSWLSPALVDSPLKWLFVLVWFAAMIAFLGAGIALLQQQSWWRSAAVAAAIISLPVAALFIQGAPLNAAAADVIILLGLLVLNWPSSDVVGA